MKKMLLFASVAAMLAACSDDDQPLVDTPVAEQGRTVTVTATLPTATRLALTEENNTIKVDWKESGETFAVVPTEAAIPATFTQTEGNQFTGTLTGSGPYYAFYPAGQLDVEENCSAASVGYSLKSQSGELDEAFTLMYAQSEDGQTFSFQHLTAIVKFTLSGLSGLEAGSEVSDVHIASTTSLPFSGTANLTTGTMTVGEEGESLYMGLADCPVATDGTCSFYAYLPPISKDNVLTMTLTTSSGDSYATTVQFSKDIEAGKYYRAARTVTKQPEAYALSSSSDVMNGLNDAITTELTKVKFVAGSPKTSETPYADANGSSAYIVTNGEWLEVHTNAQTFQIDPLQLFANFEQLTAIDFNNSVTLSGTSMQLMFYACRALTSITFGDSFDTSNVTDMSYMFHSCDNLISVDLSSFNTSNVTTMNSMFYACRALISITFGDSFDTSKVTDMGSMFNECPVLPLLDLSSFNTSKVTNMSNMFIACSKLASITFGDNFDTSNVTNMNSMFAVCYALTELDLSNFNTSNVTDMDYMFNGCTALTSLDLSNFDTSSLPTVTDMFTNVGSQLAEGQKTTIYVSTDLNTFLADKSTGLDTEHAELTVK